MRQALALAIAATFLTAAPALAQATDQPDTDKPDRPITDKTVTAGDVANTPMRDLNLSQGEIPPLLIAARDKPYTLDGLDDCPKLTAAIGELDVLLGDDVDLPQGEQGRTNPGLVAQWVVGSFIPFRGLLREVSGANAHRRQLQAAILAGVARRAFLKGNGERRKCAYPARSAPPEVFAKRLEEVNQQATAPPPPGTPAARRAARRAAKERPEAAD